MFLQSIVAGRNSYCPSIGAHNENPEYLSLLITIIYTGRVIIVTHYWWRGMVVGSFVDKHWPNRFAIDLNDYKLFPERCSSRLANFAAFA